MTRPNTQHKGFFVPNAGSVLDPVMAEPDQIDFNIAGNARWGVVTGCEVTVSAGTTAEVTAGVAVVDGLVVVVAGGQTVALGSGSSQPRFDLVGVDQAGLLKVQAGSPAADPLFPDPPTSFTALAAVLAPSGATSFSDYVVDKRHFLQTVFIGAGTGNDTLLQNRTGSVDSFRVSADGRIEWNNADTSLTRQSAGTLQVSHNLDVLGDLQVDDALTVLGDVQAIGNITGDNLQRSASFPSTAADGTILVRAGLPYFRRGGAWEQMLTTGTGGDQTGDIKQSLRSPAQMPGWLQVNGQSVSEAAHPQLFGVDGLAAFVTGVAPNRTMVLPDATDRFLLSSNTPGTVGGTDTINILEAHMPAHVHNTYIDTNGLHTHVSTIGFAGEHSHRTVSVPGVGLDGEHVHNVIDPGHRHPGAEGFGPPTPFVALFFGGANRLDGPINDASHTYAVEPIQNTASATTGISLGTAGSFHTHVTEALGSHNHPLTLQPDGTHSHTVHETSKGGGQPLSIRPKYLTVYCYVKL